MKPTRAEAMRRYYGSRAEFCRNCPHLLRKEYNGRNYYKCRGYGDSNSEGTDWRLSWQACGLFDRELPEVYTPLVEILKRAPTREAEKPIEGQMRMEEFL